MLRLFNKEREFKLNFNREKSGKWYIVLPSWPFSHAHLQMVAGADDLLSELAEDKNNVHCTVTLKKEPKVDHITLTRDGGDYGADYLVEGAKTKNLWLCPVTLYVFNGVYPDKMYISNITTD